MTSSALAQSIEDPPTTVATGYAVQLASFGTQAEAESRRVALEATGLQPLWVGERAERHAVLFGAFDEGAEAQVWRQELRRNAETADAFVVTVPVGEGAGESDALPSVFATGEATAANASLASMRGIAAYEQLQALDVEGGEAAYHTALEAALPSHGETDPMRGYIVANLGILDLKAGKDHYAAALEKLKSVARGQVAASASVRTMAMTRSAWLMHQTGDREGALCAWREIQAFTSSESVRARSRAEEVGLLLELAESGKGTHEEARRAAAEAYAATPTSQIKWRAVMELIYSETFARQPDRKAAVSARLSEAFVEKYTPLNKDGVLDREIGTAKYQAGLFHEWAGHAEEAVTWYQRALNEVPADFEGFAGYHPHAESLGGLARIAAAADDIALRDEILKDILRDHPDSQIGRQVAERWPAMAQEVEASKEAGE